MTSFRVGPGTLPGFLSMECFDDAVFSAFNGGKAGWRTTHGYPIVDILRQKDGSVTMEFALAGFRKSDLDVKVEPAKNTITVSAAILNATESEIQRRIARRNFSKSYVNYDSNLDVARTTAKFEDGILTITVPPRPETKALTVEIS